MSDRNPMLIAGTMLIVLAGIVPLIIWGSVGGWEDAIAAVVFTFIFAPVIFLAGLVLLIVGAARGRGRQQQQQQIVIMSPQQAAQHGFVQRTACAQCGTALGGREKFCIGCGAAVAHG